MQRTITLKEKEQYQKQTFIDKLNESKKQYKEGKTQDARTVLKELKSEYEYKK